jgi:thioredoxin 2
MSKVQTDDRGLIVACPSCGKANRLAFDHLGEPARCGHCQTEITAPGEPIAVGSAAQFDALVGKSSLPILVDYWAAWCGPCRNVAPELEKVARKNAGRWLVAKVDTEAVPDLAARAHIQSIPTLAVWKSGKEAARTAGAMPAERIEAFVRGAVG